MQGSTPGQTEKVYGSKSPQEGQNGIKGQVPAYQKSHPIIPNLHFIPTKPANPNNKPKMSPVSIENAPQAIHTLADNVKSKLNITSTSTPTAQSKSSLIREPLRVSGALDKHDHFDVTTAIGREYPKAQIRDLLNAPNADELIRDLAITGEMVTVEQVNIKRILADDILG